MSGLRKIGDEQRSAIVALREADEVKWTYRALGKAFNVSDTTIERVFNPEYEHKSERKGSGIGYAARWHQRIDTDAKALFAAVPLVDTRSLTGRICGDPRPGQSALDQRVKSQMQSPASSVDNVNSGHSSMAWPRTGLE